MLILGILAAIALPAFFNQKEKAGDAKAKEYAHTAQVALESCSTDNEGQYPVGAGEACSYANLRANYETTLPAEGVTVSAEGEEDYNIASESSNERTFSIIRSNEGVLTFPCSPAGGGCPESETWGS